MSRRALRTRLVVLVLVAALAVALMALTGLEHPRPDGAPLAPTTSRPSPPDHPSTSPPPTVPASTTTVAPPPTPPPVTFPPATVAPVTPPPAPPGSGPFVGVLQASGDHLVQEQQAGVDVVTIGVSWRSAEPEQGQLAIGYLAGVNGRIDAALGQGLHVVLDVGLQYAPEWVFDLPGGTRFVNQYGQAFTGSPSSGSNVANAVTNDAVRAAEAEYLAALGRHIDGHRLLAVREGGGPSGELRYPRPDYQGATNSWWAYDESTQATSPVPGWKPGTGTVEQAQAFLAAYNAALADYGAWLNAQLRAAFGTTVLMLLPGWGQRPGMVDEVVATRLQGSYDEFNEGLDWPDLLARIAEPQHSVAYTTYLDAPSFGSSPQRQDPAAYLATIAPPLGFRLGGENTGNGTRQSLKLALGRARDLGYFIVNWMDERQLVASSASSKAAGPSFADLERAITADLRG